jgi:hypothetical protein
MANKFYALMHPVDICTWKERDVKEHPDQYRRTRSDHDDVSENRLYARYVPGDECLNLKADKFFCI